MDYRLATFVRLVGSDEVLADLVDEVKAETWTKGVEHAVLVLAGGDVVLVRGGRDGIELLVNGPRGVCVEVNGVLYPVARLAWHTHPRPTGRSDHDCGLLAMLEQASSVIYEIGGAQNGTIFVQKDGVG